MAGRARVFLGCSLDGFIAGPDDDLSWLDEASAGAGQDDHGFHAFLDQVGALLMGRRTYDVLLGFEGTHPWPYGERPILVPTHRPLPATQRPVRAVAGPIEDLVAQALQAAGGKDVYVDGGDVVRQALDAGLIEELILTVLPIVIGQGVSLFTGLTRRHLLTLIDERRLGGGLVQLTYEPRR